MLPIRAFNSILSFFRQTLEDVKGDCPTSPNALPEQNNTLRPKMIFQQKITLTSPKRMSLDLQVLQKKNLKLTFGIDLSLEAVRTLDKKERLQILHVMIRRFKHFSRMRISDAKYRYNANDDFLAVLAQNLRYFSHLSSLNVDFIDPDSWYISIVLDDKCTQDLSALSKGLRDLSSLTDLGLKFKLYRITHKQFQELSSCTRYLPSLVSLSHNLGGCNNLSERTIGTLNSDLRSVPSLLSLSLDFREAKYITSKVIANLDFKRFTSLLVLNIDLTISGDLTLHSNDHNAGKYLEAFAIGLLSLHSLSALRLSFLRSCNNQKTSLSDTGMESLCLSIKSLRLLTTLSLDLSYLIRYGVTARVTDLTVQNIAQISLVNLSLLTTLTLNFTGAGNMITTASIESLSDALQTLTSMKSLTLYFSFTPINDKDMESLSNALQSLTSLTSLTLDFQCYLQISAKIFESLSKAICRLNSLEKLSVNFWECHGVSSDGLISLSGSLKFLSNLKSLLLNLYTGISNDVGNSGIAALSEGLKDLQSLKELSISLIHSNCIDFDVTALSKSLKYLNRIESFSVHIHRSTKVTDKSFDSLCGSLKHLGMLRSLSLKFEYSPYLTDETLESLCEVFTCLPFLSHLHIAIGLSDRIGSKLTEGGIENLLDSLSCLDSLKELEMHLSNANVDIRGLIMEFECASLIPSINCTM